MEQAWQAVAERQAGLLSQCQLTELGVSRSAVRRHLRVGRWAQPASHVFSTTTGPLSWHQRLWLGPLQAGPTAMIGGLTAAEVLGLQRWHRDDITVLLDDELSFEPVPGIAFFRSRRPLASMRAPTDLPLCRLEPAVLLFAGYEPHRRTALGAVTAVVQQRLTTVPRLAAWTEVMKPLRRAREFRALFGDLDSGAESLAERDLLRACRRHGVTLPAAQTPRRDRVGAQRYTDAEWRLDDGRVVVLEVAGGFHDDAWQAADDRRRARRLTTRDRVVVSCSAVELRYEAGTVMADLVALGVPRAC